jgi:hypothetical protein
MLPGTSTTPFRRAALATLAAALVLTTPAFARGGGSGSGGGGGGGDRPEVRVGGICAKGATSRLRLRARDGGIETEFEVHGRRGVWSVTIVHEREVAWRGKRRPGASSGSFSVSYRVPDYSGGDTVTARATGPRGGVCSATATLPG